MWRITTRWPRLSAVIPRAADFSLGALLIVAAAAKAFGESSTQLPVPVDVLVAIELFAAFALIFFRVYWFSRLSVAILFGVFAAYALRAGLQQRPSCDCFGEASVSPWLMATIDLLGVVSLLAFLPWSSVFTRRAPRPEISTALEPKLESS